MKNLKKLPILLAVVFALLASACSEIDVTPRTDGEDEDPPIIIYPKKTSSPTAADTLNIG
ncbi:MAG TPA: hypothetical protein VIQ51_10250 [Chryseosolibacter sp.]|jgi:hypothetical protein